MASAQGNFGGPAVAMRMRRFFGTRGGAARQDVLVAADMDAPSAEGANYRAGSAHRKAKKGVGNKRKVKGRGQSSNGFTRRTGLHNRCLKCDSEHHLAPRCPSKDKPKN